MNWTYDDGGRSSAGFKGDAGDCVARAIAIATGCTYQSCYDSLNNLAAIFERPRRRGRRSSARTGVRTATIHRYLKGIGWLWIPTMGIGTGCKVHLRDGELPMGRLIVSVSRHMTAVIDGVIHDTRDPSRNGTRCVYGYWKESRKYDPKAGKVELA